MRIHSITFALLSSFVFVACGGAGKNVGDAKDPGGDPWKDYKGTYAATANPKPETATSEKPRAASKAKAAPAQDDAAAAAEAALAEANAQPVPTMSPEPASKKHAKPRRGAKKGRR